MEVKDLDGGVTAAGIQDGAMMMTGVAGQIGQVRGKITRIVGPKMATAGLQMSVMGTVMVLGCQEVGVTTTMAGATGAGTEKNRRSERRTARMPRRADQAAGIGTAVSFFAPAVGSGKALGEVLVAMAWEEAV